jgi:hypothetical protein
MEQGEVFVVVGILQLVGEFVGQLPVDELRHKLLLLQLQLVLPNPNRSLYIHDVHGVHDVGQRR